VDIIIFYELYLKSMVVIKFLRQKCCIALYCCIATPLITGLSTKFRLYTGYHSIALNTVLKNISKNCNTKSAPTVSAEAQDTFIDAKIIGISGLVSVALIF
jgi:hypothetical protein